MPPAWQVRESQHQRKVEDLGRLVLESVEDFDEPKEAQAFMYEFAIGILRVLSGTDEPEISLAPRRLLHQVRKEVASFVRIPSETNLILMQLFREVSSSCFSDVTTTYQREAMNYPLKAFGVSRSTDEVEFS